MYCLTNYIDDFKEIADANNNIKQLLEYAVSAEPFEGVYLTSFLQRLNNVESPFILLEYYGVKTVDNKSDNFLKNIQAAFIILILVEKGNDAARLQALCDAEQYGWEVLSALAKKYKCPDDKSFSTSNFNNIQMEFVGPAAENYWGARFDFNYMVTEQSLLNR